jgi:hypothetical protein
MTPYYMGVNNAVFLHSSWLSLRNANLDECQALYCTPDDQIGCCEWCARRCVTVGSFAAVRAVFRVSASSVLCVDAAMLCIIFTFAVSEEFVTE